MSIDYYCVCCLVKYKDKKQFRAFTSADAEFYYELTKLRIIEYDLRICIQCKAALKMSTKFLRLCIKSNSELATLSDRKIVTTVLEEEEPDCPIEIDEGSSDSGDQQQENEVASEIVQPQSSETAEITPRKKTNKSRKKNSEFTCPDCGMSFSTSQRLQIHSYKHSGIKNWKCDNCDKVFATKYRLKAHTSKFLLPSFDLCLTLIL